MKDTSNLRKIHQFLQENVSKQAIAADLTAGNGYDTKFLAGNFAFVYSIDISLEAIENTKQLTVDFSNIKYIVANHVDVLDHIAIPLDIVIYNLGYLPKGDKTLVTTSETTLKSLNSVKTIIKPGGFLVVTTYLAHPGGFQEYLAVKNWIFNLKKPFLIYEYPTTNSPVSFLVYF